MEEPSCDSRLLPRPYRALGKLRHFDPLVKIRRESLAGGIACPIASSHSWKAQVLSPAHLRVNTGPLHTTILPSGRSVGEASL